MTDIIPYLPPFQAILNSTAAVLISMGYYFIRQQNRNAHRLCMSAALGVSVVFMISYLYYHANIGNIPFAGQGAIRPVYFTILATHVILAALMVPMVLTTVRFAIAGKTDRHRQLARWTFPVWLYVSVTGVLIYLMAFHLYAAK